MKEFYSNIYGKISCFNKSKKVFIVTSIGGNEVYCFSLLEAWNMLLAFGGCEDVTCIPDSLQDAYNSIL